MGVSDFKQLAQQYARRLYGHDKAHISLHRLKITTDEPVWQNDFDSPDGASPEYARHCTKRLETGHTFSAAETAEEQPWVVQVTFTKGQARGLDTMMKLVMPENIVRSGIDSLNIPLDASVSRHLHDVATVSRSHQLLNSPAVAVYNSEWNEYRDRFSCTVSLHGKVLFERQEGRQTRGGEQEIAAILEEGFKTRAVVNELDAWFDEDKVFWNVEGEIVLRTDIKHSATFKDA